MGGVPSLERAATFLYENARTLERALYARRYGEGTAAHVVAALRAYRNPDGGFGHALEPDVRAPGSMPLHCEVALRALESAGADEPELVRGVADYLAGVARRDGRVPIVTPEVLAFPRAGHWNEGALEGESLNPTAALVGLLRALGVAHAWLDRAEALCWDGMGRAIGEAHELVAVAAFLDRAEDRARAAACAERHAARAQRGEVAWLQLEPAEGYGVTVLDVCPTPASLLAPGFPRDLLERHLDALAARQGDDGGWPLTHPAPSPAAGLAWRGRWTLGALDVLHAWGRL